MSAEVEVVDDSKQSIEDKVNAQVNIGLAIRGYLRAEQRFSQASACFNESCQEVRKHLGANKKFVVQCDYKHYLVESDEQGNFEVNQIECI